MWAACLILCFRSSLLLYTTLRTRRLLPTVRPDLTKLELKTETLVSPLPIGLKANISQTIMLGVMFFTIYAAYALAFYYGTTLLLDGLIAPGVIVNVFVSPPLSRFKW